MAYNQETGVLTIDSANETFDEILDNTARALNDYRVTEVAGVFARDVGLLCTSPNVNRDSLYRPYEVGTFICPNFESGGDDGLYGYNIPVTTNGNVHDLWKKTWSDKGRPTTWFILNMFNRYNSKASFDKYPFYFTYQKGGSGYSIEYKSDSIVEGTVNPALMTSLQSYYPALQVFEQDTAATGPKTEAYYSWCSSKPVSDGTSGEYIDLSLDDSKTYYLIPFLSQYKFTSFFGNTLLHSGNKYSLIYKNFNELDWIINAATESIYSLTFGQLTLESSYSANVTFILSARTKSWNAILYGGYRVWTTYNNIESIWMEEWETYNYRLPSSGYYTITMEQSVEDTFSFSFQDSALPSNATRIEIIFKDPTHNNFTWTKSFDL